MKEQNRFYVIRESDIKFRINAFAEPLPILWCKDGMYCVLPKVVIANAIDSKTMYDRIDNPKTTIPQIYIYWSQGIPISNLAGRTLMGE